MTPGLFPPPPPRAPTRDELVRRVVELRRQYHEAGGDLAREIDREILEVQRALARLPAPTAPREVPAPGVGARKVHDGRLAATGEAQEDDRE